MEMPNQVSHEPMQVVLVIKYHHASSNYLAQENHRIKLSLIPAPESNQKQMKNKSIKNYYKKLNNFNQNHPENAGQYLV